MKSFYITRWLRASIGLTVAIASFGNVFSNAQAAPVCAKKDAELSKVLGPNIRPYGFWKNAETMAYFFDDAINENLGLILYKNSEGSVLTTYFPAEICREGERTYVKIAETPFEFLMIQNTLKVSLEEFNPNNPTTSWETLKRAELVEIKSTEGGN